MSDAANAANVLEAENLVVSFPVVRGGHRTTVRAVRGVDLTLGAGETLGIVGESGSGKSTLARAVMRLIRSEGRIVLLGSDVTDLSERHFRSHRRKVQMVFQDPYSSLNPSLTVGQSVAEPLKVHARLSARERRERVAEVLDLVGLRPEFADRYPDEFSGGQRQRIAIARAIVLEPEILICDEAVSALDVSTQNQVLSLLESLRERLGLSYLFISHDLAVVRHISDRVAVMYLGEVMEEGPVDRLFDGPAHPYTQVLLEAVPEPDPELQRSTAKRVLDGDVPDPTNPPPGCSFSSRCPYAMEICHVEPAPVIEVIGGGISRCHLHTTGPALAGAPLRALPIIGVTQGGASV
ncbi:ABC transporter ATP-binding protein [Microbacterium sp. A196]|uniref:ABC transporter ATP-binding protein n=1 Tax=unclassified Microbacterium TaxID=2609290 RepID=UPI003F35D2AA